MPTHPNIILIHTDQQRGDCLGVAGHPVLETPNMDGLAMQGVRCNRFYAACPSCIAARRSIMTGLDPQTHGMVGYVEGWEFEHPTIPSILRDHGYQTMHVGRSMHQSPPRRRYGFDDMEISSGGGYQDVHDDYIEWLAARAPYGTPGPYATGIMHNDWTAAPWPAPQHLHPSQWTVDRALRFFSRRDPSCPYFLSIGFTAPHPPLQPPAFYLERYLRTGVPAPHIGDWAEAPDDHHPGDHVSSHDIELKGERLLSARAAYYGLINHVDDLLRVLFNPVTGGDRLFGPNTIIVFTSDHGEMLGDHHLWRKERAFEASARVPFIVRAPDSHGLKAGSLCALPATHADILPTLLDMAGIKQPSGLDGRSLLPAMRGETPTSWRDCIHIEHAPNDQCVTDGALKFIWLPGSGKELFFDLTQDPHELRNLIGQAAYADQVTTWRGKLIDRLRHRPEGFVQNGRLVPGRPYNGAIPGKRIAGR